MLSNGYLARTVVSPAQSLTSKGVVIHSYLLASPRNPSRIPPSLSSPRSLPEISRTGCRPAAHLDPTQGFLHFLSPTSSFLCVAAVNDRGSFLLEWKHRRRRNLRGFAFCGVGSEPRLWMLSAAFNSLHFWSRPVLKLPAHVVRFSATQQRRWKEFGKGFGNFAHRRPVSATAVVASVDDSRMRANQKPLYDELQRYGLDESDYDITSSLVDVRRQTASSSATTNLEVGRRGMTKRRKASSEAKDKPSLKDESGVVEDWCAYLLVSGDVRKTYVGVTYDIRRRLRQHNGEIAGGAKSARTGRPWRLVCTVHGFGNRSEACQFEWTWKSTTAKVKVISRPDSESVESPLIARRRATLAKVIESKEEWTSLDVHWRDD